MSERDRLILPLILVLQLLALLPPSSATLSVTATVNQTGISGTIVFTQDSPGGSTIIDVSLTGFGAFPAEMFPLPWHVHEFPFPHSGKVTPCGAEITGGHFDPLGASQNPDYSTDCSMQTPQNCEVGDLSGKFGAFPSTDPLTARYSDQFLSLYGVNSIIGRSVVIHFANNSRLVCANIGYPNSTSLTLAGPLLYSPFRNDFTGNIFFRQHHAETSTASVYTNLQRIVGEEASTGHNWHIHRDPLDDEGVDCLLAGPHYNPRDVNVSDPSYAVMCGSDNSSLQMNCEVGDLSNKGAPFDVVSRRVRQFYTDTDLPLLDRGDEIFIENRSVVIHTPDRGAPRIACANLTRYQPLEAVSVFNENGVSGSIRFYQRSPYDPTEVRVNLRGLSGMADGYHVHEYPVGPQDLGSPAKCDGRYAGGHWNPTGVTDSGTTSDQFEIGDLSGKFGGLSGRDQISAVYTDPNIPLFGPFSILGRSIVIHRPDGSRWICSNIRHARPVLQVTTEFSMTSFSGNVTFSQPADDPYAETTIVVLIDVHEMLRPPVSSSPVVDMSPSTVAMSTSTVAMTTSSVATTAGDEPTPSSPEVVGVVTMTTNSVALSTSSVTMTSSPAPVVRPSASSTVQDVPSTFTSRLLEPTPTPSSSSPLTSTEDVGSGSALMNTLDAVTISPTSTPLSRRRRSVDRKRLRRQSGDMVIPYQWSLREQGGNGDCNGPTSSVYQSNPSLCSPTRPYACPSGDLTSKHGPLLLPQQAGKSLRIVFTDPNLPLTEAASNPMLLIQQMDESIVCVVQGPSAIVAPPMEPAPPTTATPTTVQPTTVESTQAQKDNTPVIIGAAVGGAAVAVILLIFVLVVIVVCVKRRRARTKYDLAKSSYHELGTINPTKPILGIPNYKVLYDFKPQNEDDLELAIGDWVTLRETPLGGNWWRGTVDGKGEGWFPKNFVKYVDVEAEKKRREAENFKLAAAAIVAASNSFSTRHPSLTRKKRDNVEAAPRRTQTFSRRDIDSTPKMVTKFDKPYLDTIEPPPDGVVIPNAVASSAPGSQPGTPVSTRSTSEVITNKSAMEAGSAGNSQEDNEVNKELDAGSEFLLNEQHLAKYEFSGSTDIELRFKKGSVVTVIEKADNGWWKGICDGLVGWFPETYVHPAPIETKKEQPPPTQEERVPASIDQPRGMDEMMASGGDIEATEYRAVFTYVSDTKGDLKFREGETILVYWADENGWWFGSAGSAQGWFPGSYVEPVVEISEAGSMVASPVHLTHEEAELEEDGTLANQLAAAIKKRKTKKTKEDAGDDKDSRSSFRKRWSLRRKSRDKNKGSPSANRAQESPPDSKQVEQVAQAAPPGEEEAEEGNREVEVTSPETERLLSTGSEGGIQGELASAIVRRNSIGREATLSIDEQIARGKQKRETEEQNELLNALKKRKASTEQGSSPTEKVATATGVKSPVEKEPVVFENVNVGTGSSQEDSEPHKEEEQKVLSTTPTSKEGPSEVKPVKPVVPETLEQAESKPDTATSPTTPTPQETHREEGTPVPPRTPESTARKSITPKPRRRPPPPPASTTTPAPVSPTPPTATPSSGGVKATTPTDKTPPQTTQQPTAKNVRKISAPSPTLHDKPKPAIATHEHDKKPSGPPSRTAAADKSSCAYTTSVAGGKTASQPNARPRPVKRQTTSDNLKPKYPARRPPPPPPGAVTSAQAKQPGKASPSSVAAKKVKTDKVGSEAAAGTPTQTKKRVPPSRGAPSAQPRARTKVQKVKRPVSRMIPPPPNIPLPPPPARKTPPTSKNTRISGTDTPQATAASRPQASSSASDNSSGAATGHPPVSAAPRTKPRGPKPPPPTRVSSLTPEPKKKLKITPVSPTTIDEVSGSGESPAVANKPTTPPPRRDRSDSSQKTAPVPAKRQQPPSSGQSQEQTDAPLITDSPQNRKANRSAPPERPPPPRPPSAASNTSTKIQANQDKPASKPAKPDRPPSNSSETKKSVVPLLSSSSQGKVLFDAAAPPGSSGHDESENSEKQKRGGGFVNSLKKMVKRDSNVDSSTDHSASSEAAKPTVSRPSTSSKVSSLDSKAKSAPPAKPAPPTSKTTATEAKAPPTRPPPLKLVTEQQPTKNEGEVEQKRPDKVPAAQNGEALKSPPVVSDVNGTHAPKPLPRKSDLTSEEVSKMEGKENVVKDVKAGAPIPSRPPPPKTSPSEKRKVSIPSRPPPPKTPVSKTAPSPTAIRSPSSIPDKPVIPDKPAIPDKPVIPDKPKQSSIPDKPKPMPRKDTQSDLGQKSNGSVVGSAPVAPVPTPRQQSSSPSSDDKSPTNPTGTNFYRAKRGYTALRDGELSFSEGDVIIFMERRDKGFYYGMLDNGQTGLFPTSHVEAFFH